MNASLTADDRVRTSAALPGDLWERAKIQAARRRCSLQDLLTEGLERVVEELERFDLRERVDEGL